MSDSYLLLLIFRKSEGIPNARRRKDESCTREDNLDGASSVWTVYSLRDAFSFFSFSFFSKAKTSSRTALICNVMLHLELHLGKNYPSVANCLISKMCGVESRQTKKIKLELLESQQNTQVIIFIQTKNASLFHNFCIWKQKSRTDLNLYSSCPQQLKILNIC